MNERLRPDLIVEGEDLFARVEEGYSTFLGIKAQALLLEAKEETMTTVLIDGVGRDDGGCWHATDQSVGLPTDCLPKMDVHVNSLIRDRCVYFTTSYLAIIQAYLRFTRT